MISDTFESISDVQKATEVSRNGAAAAGIVALITFGFVVFGNLGPSGLLDVGLFALVCWRICKMSRAWAVVGLLLFLAEKAIQLAKGPVPTSGWVVLALLIGGFIGGIRGTFAFHRLQGGIQQPRDIGANGEIQIGSNRERVP